jgi:hypothetical protein
VRVCVAALEQVLEELQALGTQVKVQLLKSVKDSESTASLPQEKPEVGVHACELAGCVPQFTASTGAPSLRWQEKVCDCVPDPVSATQVPARVCVKPAPQPVVGAQEV